MVHKGKLTQRAVSFKEKKREKKLKIRTAYNFYIVHSFAQMSTRTCSSFRVI